ncbi:hypothetical protein SADUNF_Sadunf07G0061200 [Salix dunnii]|uniref:Isopropylmalate dehydrogenase-like domain-containing protein n=1 Tax=Salix dunnii TaxID=1413687 RepID=A0A835JWE8_9ROSI|nr:hypothetical protein SADUNF_Sadunf07G0061200 [Salix dunnii]
MHTPVYFKKYDVHRDMMTVLLEVIESINKNKVCLKRGLVMPIGRGVCLMNVQFRKELDLYASLMNYFNLQGLPTRHENVNVVVIREDTEGEYAAVPGVVESLKKKVTTMHKANIMKLADGSFLESCREDVAKYLGIKYNDIIVDNCCMILQHLIVVHHHYYHLYHF